MPTAVPTADLAEERLEVGAVIPGSRQGEPLVSDLFSVTLTPAVPAYLARFGPTTPKPSRTLPD